MKFFDLGAGGVAAIGFLAALTQVFGPNEPSGAIFNCERVEMPGGYFNFVDPNCPAQFRDPTPNAPAPGEPDA